jgi:hypothetical protein
MKVIHIIKWLPIFILSNFSLALIATVFSMCKEGGMGLLVIMGLATAIVESAKAISEEYGKN